MHAIEILEQENFYQRVYHKSWNCIFVNRTEERVPKKIFDDPIQKSKKGKKVGLESEVLHHTLVNYKVIKILLSSLFFNFLLSIVHFLLMELLFFIARFDDWKESNMKREARMQG